MGRSALPASLVFAMLLVAQPGAIQEPSAPSLEAPPDSADGALGWRDLRVRARLDGDGVIRVTERVTLSVFGDVTAAERSFRGWIGTKVDVSDVVRVGAAGDGRIRYEVVDEGSTLRWTLRAPDDPPFPPGTRLAYGIEYAVAGAVIPIWGVRRFGSGAVIPPFFLHPGRRAAELWQAWRLAPGGWTRRYLVDHDFSPFAFGAGTAVDRASVEIAFDPVWGREEPFRREWRPAQSGADLRELLPLGFRGSRPPHGVSRPLHAVWIASLAVLPIAAFVMWGAAFFGQWSRRRRFSQAPVDAGWIELHLAAKDPGEVAQLFEGAVGGQAYPGARASLEEMTRRGQIEFLEDASGETLRLRAPRDTLTPWERGIVERLFGSYDTVDLRAAERRAQAGTLALDEVGSRAFEAASLKRGGLERRAIPTILLVVTGGLLMLSFLKLGGFQALAAGLVLGSFVYQLSHPLGRRAALPASLPLAPLAALLAPALLFSAAVVLFFLAVLADPRALLGLALLWLGLFNSLLNKARPPWPEADRETRYGLERARRYIAEELRKPVPTLEGRWLPWILALGLEEEVRASGWSQPTEAPPSDGWAARLTGTPASSDRRPSASLGPGGRLSY